MPLLVPLIVLNAAWGPYPPVAPFGFRSLPKQWVRVPMIFPVIGHSRYRNGYGDRRSDHLHAGIDIKARRMSPIVAPFSGKLGMKRESFWIYGDNGWAMLGTHLNDDHVGKRDNKAPRDLMFAPDLEPGQHVRAGQLIGYVGDSGRATGPHLHLELYAGGKAVSMSRIRNPFPSLKYAQRLSAPRSTQVPSKPPKGTMRLEGCVRFADPGSKKLILILTSKQFPNGKTVRFSKPRYVRLKAKPEDVAAVGSVPNHVPIGVWVPARPNIDGATASRVFLP